MFAKYLAAIAPTIGPRHVSTWRSKYGDALVDVLVAEGILYDAGLADWYPCGAYCGERRPVLRERLRPEQPYYAPCKVGDGCEGRHLHESELPLFGHSFSRVIDVVCAQLGISPAPNPELAVARDIHRLGTVAREGVGADVFFALAPDEHVLPLFLAARATLARRTWVLATTIQWVPDLLLTAHGAGAHVEISGLSDLLGIREGRIVRLGAATEATPAAAALLSPRAVATLLTPTGVHSLGPSEYDDVVEHASERFDLFLDVATEHHAGRRRYCVGGYRDEKGRYHDVELPPVDARGVAEFMERGREAFILPEELNALAEHDALDKLRRGWAKLDPERRSLRKQKLGYRFQPPPGVRWALVRAFDQNGPTKQGG